MQRKKIVVVGGGFAGIATIKTLLKKDVEADIVLVTKHVEFEYYPALYKLVTGALAIEVSVPYTKIFHTKKVAIIEGEYTGVDRVKKVISLADGATISYDYLVLALGSETNYFNIPGLSELSFSFKSVSEALRLKRHFCMLMNNIKDLPKEEIVSRLHVIVVGAGPSGVELAGDLRDYLKDLAREFKVDPNYITIDLIESNARVLPTMSEKVSRKADARLRKMGVNIFTNRTLMSQDIEDITMKDMSMKASTVIWTAGTKLVTSYDSLGAALTDRKRIQVNSDLTLPDDESIFIAGDGAGTTYSGLAQTAIHNGIYIGKQLTRLVRGKIKKGYKPMRPSFVIPIGKYWALFVHTDFVMSGILPWLLRSVIDFRYFTSIVPFWYVLDVYRQGAKYRRLQGGFDAAETIKNDGAEK